MLFWFIIFYLILFLLDACLFSKEMERKGVNLMKGKGMGKGKI